MHKNVLKIVRKTYFSLKVGFFTEITSQALYFFV